MSPLLASLQQLAFGFLVAIPVVSSLYAVDAWLTRRSLRQLHERLRASRLPQQRAVSPLAADWRGHWHSDRSWDPR